MSDEELSDLLLVYMKLMKSCGRKMIPESELYTFLGTPIQDIPIECFDRVYYLTESD